MIHVKNIATLNLCQLTLHYKNLEMSNYYDHIIAYGSGKVYIYNTVFDNTVNTDVRFNSIFACVMDANVCVHTSKVKGTDYYCLFRVYQARLTVHTLEIMNDIKTTHICDTHGYGAYTRFGYDHDSNQHGLTGAKTITCTNARYSAANRGVISGTARNNITINGPAASASANGAIY